MSRLGLCQNSLSQRQKRGTPERPLLRDALDLIREARKLGAGGVQVLVRGWSRAYGARVRALLEAGGMFVEGAIALPASRADVARFAAELAALREAGGTTAVANLLAGRRYEVFDTLADHEEWRKRAWTSLTLAEPVARRLEVRLAIENHKDLRADEMLTLLQHLSTDVVGVNFDTGNSIALMEDPMEVLEAYAPHALTCGLKDMAVRPCDTGFLLAEVPFGDGFLDLPRIVRRLRAARPALTFTLEMITRDPLVVPCLTEKYWTTMKHVGAHELAKMMTLVRRHGWTHPLPAVTGLDAAATLAVEEENIRRSMSYAHETLGF